MPGMDVEAIHVRKEGLHTLFLCGTSTPPTCHIISWRVGSGLRSLDLEFLRKLLKMFIFRSQSQLLDDPGNPM